MIGQEDPFSTVRLNQDQNIPEDTSQQEDAFSNVRIKESQGFPGIKEIGRYATRLGLRIAETIGGIPGDVQSLVDSGLFAGFEYLTGEKPPKELASRRFPTSSELKETSQEYLGEIAKPQGPIEEKLDEYTENVASLIGPMKFRKALGVALGMQSAKEGVKLLGLGEGYQNAAELGTMFLLTAINPKGAMKYAANQFSKANELAKGASIYAPQLEKKLVDLGTELSKGITTTSKNAVIKPAEELLGKIKNGKVDVQDLTAAKRDISTLMGDPTTLQREKKLLKKIGKDVDDAIKPFEKIRPDFAAVYRPANEIYMAVMEGSKASNYLRKTLGAKSVVGATLAEAALGHPEAIIPTLALSAGVFSAARTADFFTRLAKSPELRKYYYKTLLAAAKEDAGAVRTYAGKIEELMEKD